MANAIGIDFGTTKTIVSYLNPVTGQAELVRLGLGRDFIPTTLHVDKAGAFLFGEQADEQIERDPDGYCRGFKLHLGEAAPCLKRTGETAEELAARFLRFIKEKCEQKVFHAEVVTATITIPVKFSPARKEALRRAAEAAGFATVSFVHEPEAAGMAFLRDNPADKFSRALILDWGGGTLDIAIVSRDEDGTIHADRRCAEGRDKEIGGEVMDRLLLEYLKNLWFESFNHPLVSSEEKEPGFLRRAELAKMDLADKTVAYFQPVLQEKVEISRDRFSEIIRTLLETSVELVRSALSQNKRQGKPEPDAILLVGGTTNLPIVQELMKKEFPNLRVISWHHSQEAVAIGATWYGNKSSGMDKQVPNGKIDSGESVNAGKATNQPQFKVNLSGPRFRRF